jgi:omega-6 fatty acid desaturase (delta-12 desaturase)
MTTIGFAVLVQHTHPDVAWSDGLPNDRAPAAELATTQWLFPKWFTFMSHNSMDHIVHHLNPRVPCYNLGAASDRLRELMGERLVRERFTLARLNDVLRSCRLYDYRRQQWLDFDGTPTTRPLAGGLAAEADISDMDRSRAAS